MAITPEQLQNPPPASNSKKGQPRPAARVIAISSGKGGVGKSSLSLNLAVELSQFNKRVCILDADTNLANINIMTGLNSEYTLQDFLQGRKKLKDIMLIGPAGIGVIPAASGVMDLIRYDQKQQDMLLSLVKRLECYFDYILIDTAAGINETVLGFVQAAPETIITITPEPTSLTDAFSLLRVLKHQGFNQSVQVVVNKVESFNEAKTTLARFSRTVKKYLGFRITSPGYILEDRNVPRSIMAQRPYILLYPHSPASRCIRNFAYNLNHKNKSSEIRFSLFLSEKKYRFEQKINEFQITLDKPWMNDLLATIYSEELHVVEQFIALISHHWLQRVEQEQNNDKIRNSDSYRAAMRFASKLNNSSLS